MSTHDPKLIRKLKHIEDQKKSNTDNKDKNTNLNKDDTSTINNINENLDLKYPSSNLINKNLNCSFNNDYDLVNEINSYTFKVNKNINKLDRNTNRKNKNRESRRVLSLANNNKFKNKEESESYKQNNKIDKVNKIKENIQSNIREDKYNFILKQSKKDIDIENMDCLKNYKNNFNSNNIKNNSFEKIISPSESTDANKNEENKIKDKNYQNFLKPNSMIVNNSLSNLNNHLILQNTLLANNLNSGFNNLLSETNISNFNNNITNTNNPYTANNFIIYTTTPTTNLNSLSNTNLLANNNINNQIHINNSSSINLDKIQIQPLNNNNVLNNESNNNNNNTKKDIIDFTDLQSIKKLKQHLYHEHETPGTVTEHNLNTISSLHSNLIDLNTIESKRKSNYSISPFFSNNIHNFQNFFLKENNSFFTNQNKLDLNDKISNSVIKNNSTYENNDLNQSHIDKNINIEFVSEDISDRNSSKNNLNQSSDIANNLSFGYVNKNSANSILADNSPIDNQYSNVLNYNLNNNNITTASDALLNNNLLNNKRSNFSLFNKFNNINHYNNINIKINNMNDSATKPNNSNYPQTGGKIQNFKDFISNINNYLNNPVNKINNVNNINSTPSPNNSNTLNKHDYLNNSGKTSNETINDLTDQNLTPLNNLSNLQPINNSIFNNNVLINNILINKNNYRIPNLQNNTLNPNLIIADLPTIIRNQQDILLLKSLKENFETLENSIFTYIRMYPHIKDNTKFLGNYEVLNFFSKKNLQNYIEKMSVYINDFNLLFKNVCEKYKSLYLDSDPEIKYVILKKILNDIERIHEQTLQAKYLNLLSNIQPGNNKTHISSSSSNKLHDNHSNKNEIYKYGFKDIAEKYCSNIQKSNDISNNLKKNDNSSIFINNLNTSNNLIGLNSNEFMTPRGNF